MKKCSLTFLFVLGALMVRAELATGSFEDPVNDVVSFTNAIIKQKTNPKIYIADGVYDLSALSDDARPLEVSGYGDALFYLTSAGVELIGKSGDPAKVVIKATNSIYRLCRIGSGTAAIRNVTLDGGDVQVNGEKPIYNYRVGGGVALSANGMVSNCVIRNCRAATRGGAVAGLNSMNGRVYDCVFYGNYGSSEATVAAMVNEMRNCIFTNNIATPQSGGYSTRVVQSSNLYDCLIADNTGNYSGGLVNGSATNCRFINNRIDNGEYGINYSNPGGGGARNSACTNCYFFGNSSYRSGGAIRGGIAVNCTIISNEVRNLSDAAGGGGIYEANWVENCFIATNTCRFGAGTANCKMITNCVIACNTAGAEGGGSYKDVEIWHSTIVSNTAASAAGGLGYPGAVHQSTIGWNYAAGYGGASYSGTFYDSLFVGNASDRYASVEYCGAGGISYGSAIRCTFRDNTAAANEAKLFDGCDVSDRLGCFTNLNCIIHNTSNAERRVALNNVKYPNGVVISNIYMIADCRVMRNCLVTNCCWKIGGGNYVNSAVLTGPTDAEVTIDNCTFADNVMYHLYRHYQDCSIVFRNCAFVRNRASIGGSAVDVRGMDATKFCFSNCVWNVSEASATRAEGFVDSGNVALGAGANPKFVETGDHPYSPKPSSPLVKNKGVKLDWMDDATDLAGNARLRDGKVDIGCYQCWLDPLGMMLLLR